MGYIKEQIFFDITNIRGGTIYVITAHGGGCKVVVTKKWAVFVIFFGPYGIEFYEHVYITFSFQNLD